jgi:hypothetical protein
MHSERYSMDGSTPQESHAMRTSLKWILICAMLVLVPFLLVRAAYSQEPDDSVVAPTLSEAQLDSVLWYAEEMESLYRKEKALRTFDTDSLSAVLEFKEWQLEMAKKERAGMLSDPRLWFSIGAIAGLFAANRIH